MPTYKEQIKEHQIDISLRGRFIYFPNKLTVITVNLSISTIHVLYYRIDKMSGNLEPYKEKIYYPLKERQSLEEKFNTLVRVFEKQQRL